MTDAELRDAAWAELVQTTIGWLKPNGAPRTSPGTHWTKAKALLDQIGQAVPPPPPPPSSGVLRAHFTDFGSSWDSSPSDHNGQIFQNRASLGVGFGLQTLLDPQTPWASLGDLAISEILDELGNPGFRFRCNPEMLASSGGKKVEIYQNESSIYIPNIVRGVPFTDEISFYVRFPSAGNPNGFPGNTNAWNVIWQHDTSKISGFGIDMQASDDPPRFYCGLGSSQVGPWRVVLPWKAQFDVTYHFRFEVFWSTSENGTWKWWVKRPTDPVDVQYMDYTGVTCFGAKPNTEFGYYGPADQGKNNEVILSDIRVTHH